MPMAELYMDWFIGSPRPKLIIVQPVCLGIERLGASAPPPSNNMRQEVAGASRVSRAVHAPRRLKGISRFRHPDGRTLGCFDESAVEREHRLAPGGGEMQRIGEVHTLLRAIKRLGEKGGTLHRNVR